MVLLLPVASRSHLPRDQTGMPPALPPEPIDLTLLPSLNKFYIDFEITSSRLETLEDIMLWFNQLLRNGGSRTSHLSELTIRADYQLEPLPLDIPSWEEVCRTLLSGRFPNLQRLDIFIGSYNGVDETKGIVESLNYHECFAGLRQKKGFELNIISQSRCWFYRIITVFVS